MSTSHRGGRVRRACLTISGSGQDIVLTCGFSASAGFGEYVANFGSRELSCLVRMGLRGVCKTVGYYTRGTFERLDCPHASSMVSLICILQFA